jgi:hypothetical protein
LVRGMGEHGEGSKIETGSRETGVYMKFARVPGAKGKRRVPDGRRTVKATTKLMLE